MVAVLMWLATRVALVLLTMLVAGFQEPNTPLSLLQLAGRWEQWDGKWYVALSQAGYGREPIVGPVFCPCVAKGAAAFFPLYPLLVHGASLPVSGENVILAALLVSNSGALAAFIGIGLLAAGEARDPAAGGPALLAAAAYPLAFFTFAPFTEGVFVAFAALSLYSARRGAWLWASLTAFLAGLTRPTAVALILPLLWEYGRHHGWWSRRRAGWRFAGAGLGTVRDIAGGIALASAVPLALALFFAYLWFVFHDPLAYLHAQREFHDKQAMSIPATLQLFFSNFLQTTPEWRVIDLVDFGPVLIFTLVAVLEIRRVPLAFTLYTLTLIYLVLGVPDAHFFGGDILSSAGRYLGAAVPAFLALGRWSVRWPWLEVLIVAGGFLLQGALVVRFLAGGWVG
jgi:Gpi18-like mannosyltransferase